MYHKGSNLHADTSLILMCCMASYCIAVQCYDKAANCVNSKTQRLILRCLFDMGNGRLCREMDTRYPSAETVFEYFVDVKNKQWLNWETKLSSTFKPPADVPAYKVLVPTVDTTRNKFVSGALVRTFCHTLVVGAVGVGKTMTIQSMLDALPADRSYCVINFSAQTSSSSLQV